jgi:hypothetical protein
VVRARSTPLHLSATRSRHAGHAGASDRAGDRMERASVSATGPLASGRARVPRGGMDRRVRQRSRRPRSRATRMSRRPSRISPQRRLRSTTCGRLPGSNGRRSRGDDGAVRHTESRTAGHGGALPGLRGATARSRIRRGGRSPATRNGSVA